MDIEKLIEQLHNFEECAYGYHINGEVLGVDCSDFEQVMVDAAEEISKIPTLQAENERLKNKLSELAHLPFDEPGIGERTRLMAENAELRAELEQVKRERDAAVEDLHKLCPAWKWDGEPSNLLTVPFTAGRQTPGCGLLRLSGSTARRRDRYIGRGRNGQADLAMEDLLGHGETRTKEGRERGQEWIMKRFCRIE